MERNVKHVITNKIQILRRKRTKLDLEQIPHLFSKVDNIHIHLLFFQALCQFNKLQEKEERDK